MQIHGWCTDWAAWRCIEIALNGRKYMVTKVDGIRWFITDDKRMMFRVIGNENEVMAKPSRDWSPHEPILSQLHQIAGIIKVPDTPHEPEGTTKVRERNKRKTKTRAQPVSKDGLVTIAEICNELGMNPRDARKILRNKVEKPDAGWAWPKSEVASIKKMLK